MGTLRRETPDSSLGSRASEDVRNRAASAPGKRVLAGQRLRQCLDLGLARLQINEK